MRAFLAGCAVVLAIIAVVGGVSYFLLRPKDLKVAVPASDLLDQRLFGQAADMLRAARAPARIEMVPVDNTKAAMDALESGKVKLAVMRSDAALQGRAQTVMILRREIAVLVAPKVGKVQKVADLQNVMIGVARDGPLDGGLLKPVLDYYGLSREKAKYMALPADEIANAFRQKKVDAMIAIGPVTSKPLAEAVADAARGVKGAIQFLDIEEADAIAKRIPALESVEVDQGAFGGRPPRPDESFNTLGYSIRLVATQKTDTDTIAELIRQLFLIRQNLAAAIPGAGLMEAPDTDEASAFLIHPGVRAYVNGDQKSLFDRYSDYIYLVLFLGSGLGSVVAGLFGLMSGKREDRPAVRMQQMQHILDAARDAQSADELDRLDREADEVFRSVFEHGAKDELSDVSVASFSMAMTELRSRMAQRRAALTG